MSTLNKEKYENAILYLCNQQRGNELRGKKKLAKLLYFLDFDRFEYEESMETVTGDTYIRMPMGPVPNAYGAIIAEMGSVLEVEQVPEYAGMNPTTIYRAKADADLSVFDETDLKILKRVADKYSRLHGTELENLSHQEAPWIASGHRDTIPFELAFYRDTDFSDAA